MSEFGAPLPEISLATVRGLAERWRLESPNRRRFVLTGETLYLYETVVLEKPLEYIVFTVELKDPAPASDSTG